MTEFSAIRATICGLNELDRLGGSGVTHVLSIIDPGNAEPDIFTTFRPHFRVTLRFHDEIVSGPSILLPQSEHIMAILTFGRSLTSNTIDGGAPHVLVHCQMGISRSTAAMATLFAFLNPEEDERKIFARVLQLRPEAWPNCRMIALADELLQRKGRLTMALGRLYGIQLARRPTMGSYLRANGRAREVEMALLARNDFAEDKIEASGKLAAHGSKL